LTVSDLDKAIKEHTDLLSKEEEVLAERRKILDKHRLKEISDSTIYVAEVSWISAQEF